MTERQLRAELQGIVDSHYCESCKPTECACRQCHDIRELLADEPDVVKVLRWLEKQTEWGKNHQTITAAHWADYCNAMIERFKQKFHVRLTYCPDCGGTGYLPTNPNDAGGFCGCQGHSIGWEWTENEP